MPVFSSKPLGIGLLLCLFQLPLSSFAASLTEIALVAATSDNKITEMEKIALLNEKYKTKEGIYQIWKLPNFEINDYGEIQKTNEMLTLICFQKQANNCQWTHLVSDLKGALKGQIWTNVTEDGITYTHKKSGMIRHLDQNGKVKWENNQLAIHPYFKISGPTIRFESQYLVVVSQPKYYRESLFKKPTKTSTDLLISINELNNNLEVVFDPSKFLSFKKHKAKQKIAIKNFSCSESHSSCVVILEESSTPYKLSFKRDLLNKKRFFVSR